MLDGKKTAKLTGLTADQMARMEREMTNLQGQYKAVEQTYGQDVLNLVLAKGYAPRRRSVLPPGRSQLTRHRFACAACQRRDLVVGPVPPIRGNSVGEAARLLDQVGLARLKLAQLLAHKLFSRNE